MKTKYKDLIYIKLSYLSIAFVVIYLFVYLPLLFTSFFPNSDDVWYVLQNPQFNHLNLITLFTESYNGQYSPLNTFFLYLIHQEAGFNAFYYHLYSFLLHTANGILLFFILQKLIRDNSSKLFISICTTFIFLIHPLQIETVAWISASKWLLVTFFMLLGILFYLQYRLYGIISCSFYCFICFILALFSKEVSVIFPVLLLIVELFLLQSRTDFIKNLLPYFGLSFFFGLFTLYFPVFKPDLQILRVSSPFTFLDNIFFSFRSLGDYLCFLAVPFYRPDSLSFISGHQNILPALLSVLIFAIFVLIFCFTKSKILIGCFLFFLANILFTLPVVPATRAALIADRYIYIAGIGIWGGLVYIVSKQKYSVRFFFIFYLIYLIIIAFAESLKWSTALNHAIF